MHCMWLSEGQREQEGRSVLISVCVCVFGRGGVLNTNRIDSLSICRVLLLQPWIENIAVPQAKASTRLVFLDIGYGLWFSHYFNEANAMASGETAIRQETEIKTLLLPDVVHYVDDLQSQHILTKVCTFKNNDDIISEPNVQCNSNITNTKKKKKKNNTPHNRWWLRPIESI